jgi:hypothetical protein
MDKSRWDLKLTMQNMSYSKRTVTFKWEFMISNPNGKAVTYEKGLDVFVNLYIDGYRLYAATPYNSKQLYSTTKPVLVDSAEPRVIASGEVELPYEAGTNIMWFSMFGYLRNNIETFTTEMPNRTQIKSLTNMPFYLENGRITFSKYGEGAEMWETTPPINYQSYAHGFYNTTVTTGKVCVPASDGVQQVSVSHNDSYGNTLFEYNINTPAEGVYEYEIALDAVGANNLYNAIKREAAENNRTPYNYHKCFDYIMIVRNNAMAQALKEDIVYVISSTTPVVTGTAIDTNGATLIITGDENMMVRNFSNVLATISASAQGGATIVETGISNNGVAVTNVDSYTFNKAGSNIFEFYAKDNRGEIGTAVVIMPVIEYTNPTAKITTGTITGDGETYVKVTGNFFTQNIGETENVLLVEYRYKVQGADDSQYSDWIRLHDVEIDYEKDLYVATGFCDGLDYNLTYEFQAYASDALDYVYSPIYIAVSIPVFDWSEKDFNFNVPVDVKGKLTVEGTEVQLKGDIFPNTLLWEGEQGMGEGESIILDAPISTMPHGIVLVFSSGTSDTAWSTAFVPKAMISFYNGGYHTFLLTSTGAINVIGAKALYIDDGEIRGHSTNLQSDSKENSGAAVIASSSFFVLRYVIGV